MSDSVADAGSEVVWHKRLFDIRILLLLLFGFSAGLPILLIFSTLSLWLSEAGVSRSAVTFFSWAALGYSFKFVWAPLVDKLPVPLLASTLGRRRGWLLLAQIAVVFSIVLMALTNPIDNLAQMAVAAVLLGFSSATQDIVIDAYRIECADDELQAMLSSAYIAGYRIGMVAAGAGGLYLAAELGSQADNYSYLAWRNTYLIMSAVMGIGMLTTLLAPEPDRIDRDDVYRYSSTEYLRLLLLFGLAVVVLIIVYRLFPLHWFDVTDNKLIAFLLGSTRLFTGCGLALLFAFALARAGLVSQALLRESYVRPVQDFFSRYGKLAIWVLLLVGFYRLSDIVMGVVANIFYADMGYSKKEIASITKVFGLLMTIAGSFIGGALAVRYGVRRVLLIGAILAALTNLLFMLVADLAPDIRLLTVVIAADNLAAGLAVAAFVAWLSSLTSLSFTAVQYALFSSVMTLFPKLLGGYSGTLVDSIGYSPFFLLTACLGIPVILLVIYVSRRMD